MKIAITGSHGLIGRHLIPALRAEGHDVLALVRGPAGPGEASWDPASGTLDARAIAGVDGAIHLAGAGLASRRWTEDYQRQILDSRIQGTQLLARTLASLDPPPKVLLSGSAIGFYGDRGDDWVDEDSAGGDGFLADVVRQWEAATAPANSTGIRTVLLRTGIVIAADGGALKPQLPIFKVGAGGRLGSGRQWTSWVSIDDEVGAILHSLRSPDLAGPVNIVAPEPVTNAVFTRTLAQVLHRPAVLVVPSAALRLALGRAMAEEMLLASQRVRANQLIASGYQWRHRTLSDALEGTLDR